MTTKTLIAAALAGLTLGANAAFADDWAFDDAYWKQPATQSAQQTQSGSRVQTDRDPLRNFNDYNG